MTTQETALRVMQAALDGWGTVLRPLRSEDGEQYVYFGVRDLLALLPDEALSAVSTLRGREVSSVWKRCSLVLSSPCANMCVWNMYICSGWSL